MGEILEFNKKKRIINDLTMKEARDLTKVTMEISKKIFENLFIELKIETKDQLSVIMGASFSLYSLYFKYKVQYGSDVNVLFDTFNTVKETIKNEALKDKMPFKVDDDFVLNILADNAFKESPIKKDLKADLFHLGYIAIYKEVFANVQKAGEIMGMITEVLKEL